MPRKTKDTRIRETHPIYLSAEGRRLTDKWSEDTYTCAYVHIYTEGEREEGRERDMLGYTEEATLNEERRKCEGGIR